MKINKITFYFLIIILIIGCRKKDQLNTYNKIDSLLVKANNDFLDKEVRLAYIDSVSFILEDLKPDSLYNFYRFKVANRYYNLNLFDKYKKLTLQINNDAIAAKDTLTITKCNSYLGDYYYENFKLDSSFLYYHKAVKFSNSIKNAKLKIEINNNLGRILNYQNQFLESEKYSLKALNIAKKSNVNEYLFESYSTLGLSELGLKEYNKAIFYFSLAEKSLGQKKNDTYSSVLKAQNYINFCDVYNKKKDYKNLYLYSEKGLKLENLRKIEPSTYAYLKNYYGLAKLKSGNKNAIKDFEESLVIGDSLKFKPIQNTSNLNFSEYYLSIKDTLKAKLFLEKVYQSKVIDDKLKALEKLNIIDPKNTKNYRETIQLKDSLFDNERQTRDKFARIEYETDEIIDQNENIQQENKNITQRLWSVSAVATIIILIVLLIYLVKSRNLKHKELNFIREQQESKEEIYDLMLNQHQHIEEGKYLEKRRISQELHDGVMGKLTAIRLNLFILKKRQDPETIEKCLPIIDEIQHIEKEIRQISHDLNQNLFDDNVTFISIVENLFAMINNHSDIEFNLFVDDRIDWDLINNISKINVYRIIQEALQNIDKYAQATKVILSMKKVNESIQIQIIDNGIGFNTNTSKKGIGLENMKNRMKEINGNFQIDSKNNIGTTISLIFNI